MPHYFTRAEAEDLLPRLEPVLRELQGLRAELREAEAQTDALRLKMRGNGHTHVEELARLQANGARLVEAINEHIRQINAWGVLVKDLEMGLVDFPARRDGHDIYLCWRLGEPGIAWWHTIEGGFSAREPLED